VDLGAVKAASAGQLAACAASAARNGQDLLHDAEVLVAADCPARAYSLAALAVEECGKAASLATLAVLPESVRAQAPVGRFLQWHQLKQVGGVLLTLMPVGTIASRLADLPAAEVTQILGTLATPADEADRLKRRGLYVDMDRGGQIRDPSQITSAEVTSQLSRARRAAESAGLLVNRELQAHLANPREDATQLAVALVSALAEAGYARTPQAAADVIINAASKFRQSTTTNETKQARPATQNRPALPN
jgi:AbiV family abortive infection protein